MPTLGGRIKIPTPTSCPLNPSYSLPPEGDLADSLKVGSLKVIFRALFSSHAFLFNASSSKDFPKPALPLASLPAPILKVPEGQGFWSKPEMEKGSSWTPASPKPHN